MRSPAPLLPSPRQPVLLTALLLPLALSACHPKDDPNGHGDSGDTDVVEPQDIVTTDLALDVGALTGRATLVVQPATGADTVSLDVSGLTLSAVTVDGASVTPDVVDGMLTVPTTSGTDPATVVVDYAFPARSPATFDGWMPSLNVSFVWPYYCSNLFPCNPALEDGVTFTMSVTGYDPGLTAVYPTTTTSDGPAYMAAVAVGDYTKMDLGATTAGTRLSAWYFTGDTGEADALAGTEHLLSVYDYYERTYGPYAFGPEAGTVEVNWGADSWGGMEHHPYVHVGKFDFEDEEAQAHEAGHAWFGDGVRMACWEDFVLSEGTTTYIAAHAMEKVAGPDFWSYYVDDFLVPTCEGLDVNTVVLPDTCNEIDFVNDDLWSLATYMKGACFYEDVADLIGDDVVDEAISEFYMTHVNGTARMRDMIDLIESKASPADKDLIETLVTEWLLTLECPENYAERCRTHQQ